MIVNGFWIRNNEKRQIEVVNLSGVKFVADGPGCKRRALEWARKGVAGSMTQERVAEFVKAEQIEKCYEEAGVRN